MAQVRRPPDFESKQRYAPGDEIDTHINVKEPDFGFASLVRCSVSKIDTAAGK